ncbi:MAG: M1 family metallopeptidase [Anaerolineales bacterium]|nr:M1 family metallopeptidase [Anaerolineales bacterium]
MPRTSSLTLPFLLLAVLVWTLAGCAGLDLLAPSPAFFTAIPPTVTPNPNPSPTPTPFQPLADASATEIPPATLTPVPPPTLPPTPTSALSLPPTPIPVSVPTRPQYVLSVLLDYTNHSLSVDETIIYPNLSADSLSSIVLAVEPNRWMGAFQLGSLAINGQVSADYLLSGQRLEIFLPQPLVPGAAVVLNMHFEIYLPWMSFSQIFGFNIAQVNLVDWYPFVAPYLSGQGWLLHEPRPVGEHLVYDGADFEVTIQLADPTLPVTIAASAPVEPNGAGMRYTLSNARAFVFSASTRYLTSTTTVGPVVVTSYYFAGHDAPGQAILQAVAAAISVYSDRYAPYPYASMSIVETYYPDGMEYGSLFFLNKDFYRDYDGTARNNLITIGVHEAAHAWWFGLVGNDQALEPWLDEALCIYSERIFYETTYPNLVSWWWNFRVYGFQPTGWVDASIYDLGSFRPYTNAVYLRGALFLEALRVRIGDEAFFAFLRDYAAQMAGRRATAGDFWAILALHTSADISDLRQAYFKP